MKTAHFFIQAGILLACLSLLSHCAGEEYSYTPDHELKPGPGLFSGEDGKFKLIFSDDTREKEEGEQGEQKSTSEKEKTK